MYPKFEISQEQIEKVVTTYKSNLSVIKTAKIFGYGNNRTRKILKDAGALLTLSGYAKLRTGEKNPFFGKEHKQEFKEKISQRMKTMYGKLNSNYKHGRYLRRPRDYKIAEFRPIRNFVFNRDNHTCQITGKRGGNLHAHHLIPFWVCKDAFFDAENIITVSTEAHLKTCHKGDWARFNADLVPDKLLQKYSIDRERLNELADLYNKSDAIVRSSAINKTEASVRNESDLLEKP
jgi:hypothetical protein